MKILLAIDDSKFSEAATQALLERPQSKDTEVRVLHVVEPAGLYLAGEMGAQVPDLSGVWEARLEQAKELVARTAERLRGAGLKVSTSVEEGDPKARILDCAAAWSADLIVVGSHGRKGLNRFLLGSVSEAVARHARCSVEIVRNHFAY